MRIAVVNNEEKIVCPVVDCVCEVYRDKPSFVLGPATGPSPIPLYDELVYCYEAGEISFAQVQFSNLDKYIDLPRGHFEGYVNFIRRHLAGRVDMVGGAAHGPDGQCEDLDEGTHLCDQAIKDAGGINIQVLGIGPDGYIDFNEPGGSLSSRIHVGALTEQIRRDNARFPDGDIDQIPTHCVTQGIGTVMDSCVRVFIATGEGKAQTVKEIIEGGMSQR